MVWMVVRISVYEKKETLRYEDFPFFGVTAKIIS